MEQEMENPEYRKVFEEGWPAFQLEVQFLTALEKKHWSYSDLAKILHTHRSSVCRDLTGGGLKTASISRIAKMANALGMKFFPICVSEEKAKATVPVIKKLVRFR